MYLMGRKPYKISNGFALVEKNFQSEIVKMEFHFIYVKKSFFKIRKCVEVFWLLVDNIKDYEIFQPRNARQIKFQTPVLHQLLLLLHHLGTAISESSNPWLRKIFKIGEGNR